MDRYLNSEYEYSDDLEYYAPSNEYGYESAPLEEETYDEFQSLGEDEFFRFGRRSGYIPYSKYRRSMKKMNRQLAYMRKLIRKLDNRYGRPKKYNHQLEKLENKISNLQMRQIIPYLFNIPELKSITLQNSDGTGTADTKTVVDSTFKRKDLIIPFLLNSGLWDGFNSNDFNFSNLLPYLPLLLLVFKDDIDFLSNNEIGPYILIGLFLLLSSPRFKEMGL